MGEWRTVYEDEVEGRWVTLKTYESEDDADLDEGPVVRVTVTPVEDAEVELEKDKGQEPFVSVEDNATILDPNDIGDLEDELLEVGFSAEAALWIVSKVPA